MLVDLRIFCAPQSNLTVLVAALCAGLPVKIQEWVFSCLAASSLPLSNFVNLSKLFKQTVASTTDVGASWLNLLPAYQGDATIPAHTE